ncbi:MAG: helix-turn-helix transcriptional regulator [Flavobacteriales bacterium]|nr:helix-turn-helix transcriptional regulator [Flavobacteriales bacterium]
MKLRGIRKPYTFLTTHGFTHHTAHRLIAGKPRSFSFAHLEKLCRILNCEPHDLFDYKATAEGVLPEKDHLLFLRKEAPQPLQSLVNELSMQEMQALTEEIAARYRKAG